MRLYHWTLYAQTAVAQAIFQPQHAANSKNVSRSISINLFQYLDNRGFGMQPGDANFDGTNSSYPAAEMPPAHFQYNGFNFDFPQYKAAGNDNVIADGQTINVPQGQYVRVSMLAASEEGLASGTVNATYADGTISTGSVLVPSWWSWPYPFGGDIVMPYYLNNKSVDYNRSNIFQTDTWLDGSKSLSSLVLPIASGADSGPGGSGIETRLHIFAISLLPAAAESGAQMEVQEARTTQKWLTRSNKTQIVEVVVNNVGDEWISSDMPVDVTMESAGLKVIQPAVINRLRPGDQAIVELGVVNSEGTPEGTSGEATIVLSTGVRHNFNATFGISQYEPTYESIYSHEAPPWYLDVKYGIFIHWGVYSVPAWGSTGEDEVYAEWYWWALNQGPDTKGHTFEHHNETYGPDVVYDDFIVNFTASVWDPVEWVNLFSDAGAEYFVQVSKHHDGYAIFDIPSNITNRTSVALEPHRDFVGDLFAAARKHQPHLHMATYFSLPEWFHPDYAGIGFGSWPGGNATNPFNNETLPYTGYVPVDDFVSDLIVPEMKVLAHDPRYSVEIMWCDIGGANRTVEFAAEWFNAAASEGRQVLMNARCGLPGDFDTPEYARYPVAQRRKWETNQGLDPYSYGYNAATPEDKYMNSTTLVSSLVDIVSKNGNFLLDVGPTANGTIIEVQQRTLREAGAWIKDHAEAIFNTTYWFVTPQEGESVRFTKTNEAFYITLLDKVEGAIEIESPVPWIEGDKVTIVGGNMSGQVVPSDAFKKGVRLNVSDDIWNADRFAWVFKITY